MGAYASYVQQYTQTVSIPRDGLAEISQMEDLSKTELRILFALFSRLNGYKRHTSTGRKRDPMLDPKNYTRIDKKALAYDLNLKKKDVSKAINKLLEMELIERGENEVAMDKDAYRFTF